MYPHYVCMSLQSEVYLPTRRMLGTLASFVAPFIASTLCTRTTYVCLCNPGNISQLVECLVLWDHLSHHLFLDTMYPHYVRMSLQSEEHLSARRMIGTLGLFVASYIAWTVCTRNTYVCLCNPRKISLLVEWLVLWDYSLHHTLLGQYVPALRTYVSAIRGKSLCS